MSEGITPKEFTVGLAVGNGTGPELADVFQHTLLSLAGRAGRDVAVVRCPHRFKTYGDMEQDGFSTTQVAKFADSDAATYCGFLGELAAAGCPVVFRTAFNAQSLYLVRERLLGVKVECLPKDDGEIILVRDQTQGFYGGVNDSGDDIETLVRTCSFSRAQTVRVLDFARGIAAERWGGADRIEHFCAVYKFHLLDNRFALWVRDYAQQHGARIHLVQPDTMNRHLLHGTYRGRLLVVGSNEWGDIMHADLVTRYGLGTQEERCSWNAYLAPGLHGLVEYQTVHGSADDIAGRGLVNPLATMRAAAHILGRFGGCPEAVAEREGAIRHVVGEGRVTPDMGGRHTTREVMEAVLSAAETPRAPAEPATAGRASECLVVVDMQNDFCASEGRFAQLGLIRPEATAALAERVGRLVDAARRSGIAVVFTRMVADERELPGTMAARNRATGRSGYLRPDAWGSDFFAVQPRRDEAVFVKGGYDVFFNPDFERYLRARGIERLVLTGAFTDLCVDALARTAYQNGIAATVVRDATLALRRDQDECLSFMNSFYNTAVADSAETIKHWQSTACTNPPPAS